MKKSRKVGLLSLLLCLGLTAWAEKTKPVLPSAEALDAMSVDSLYNAVTEQTITLGMTRSEVEAVFGVGTFYDIFEVMGATEEQQQIEREAGRDWHTYTYGTEKDFFYVLYSDGSDAGILYFMSMAPNISSADASNWYTKSGLSLGNTREDILALYEDFDLYEFSSSDDFLHYSYDAADNPQTERIDIPPYFKADGSHAVGSYARPPFTDIHYWLDEGNGTLRNCTMSYSNYPLRQRNSTLYNSESGDAISLGMSRNKVDFVFGEGRYHSQFSPEGYDTPEHANFEYHNYAYGSGADTIIVGYELSGDLGEVICISTSEESADSSNWHNGNGLTNGDSVDRIHALFQAKHSAHPETDGDSYECTDSYLYETKLLDNYTDTTQEATFHIDKNTHRILSQSVSISLSSLRNQEIHSDLRWASTRAEVEAILGGGTYHGVYSDIFGDVQIRDIEDFYGGNSTMYGDDDVAGCFVYTYEIANHSMIFLYESKDLNGGIKLSSIASEKTMETLSAFPAA